MVVRRKFALVFSFLFLMACNNNNAYQKIVNNPQLITNTVHELNTVVMGNNFGPVVASRHYAYAAIAAYEVIAAGYPQQYQSFQGQLNGLNAVAKPDTTQPINYNFAAILAYCKVGEAVSFPEGSMKTYVDSLVQLVKKNGMSEAKYNATKQYADGVAQSIIAWSKKDNYAETRSMPKFTVNDSPGRWVPTPPAYAQAMAPHWILITPMVMDSASQFRAEKAIPFNVTDKKSPYYLQVKMMLDSCTNLTPEQKHIANFWDDNPGKLNVNGHAMFVFKKFSPAGHWMSIAGIASKKAGADFTQTVYATAKTAIAFFDAFIQCWNEKYTYNTIRPESVINKYFEANWRPELQTPPFPEYTCGHCTISASAAEALTSIYGDNFPYTVYTELEFGIPSSSYQSFRQAALENEKARFYGGLHYWNSCEQGHNSGIKVGTLVVQKLRMKK
jgi:hypothetical protein